ncbi:DUF3977 family protein [Priestia koreensis]|uniref:DUF3977 family protein n=1 Tax=Priestia koreensis TaxID=284581 RepID=UPI001F598758|nr:DUF3977 family protein [Priestia koreensis]UNL83357.1 DUF3977 family protein [Priestia koreensis]
MKFIEFGIGNTWLVRTETELQDGTEFEEKGVIGPIKLQSIYVRIWIGQHVGILDSREGLKYTRKKRREFKLLLGIKSG